MLRGKVKEAILWITQRMTSHVLTPTVVDSNSGKDGVKRETPLACHS